MPHGTTRCLKRGQWIKSAKISVTTWPFGMVSRSMIEIKNISKTYGKKKQLFEALKDITFTIPSGASVAIVGKSGSGKSTLMHAISGLDRPQTGKVVIDGRDILKMKTKKIDAFRSEN